jgi:hypothetical protein
MKNIGISVKVLLGLLFLISKVSFAVTVTNHSKDACEVILANEKGSESVAFTLQPGQVISHKDFKPQFGDIESPLEMQKFVLTIKLKGSEYQSFPALEGDVSFEVFDGSSAYQDAGQSQPKTWKSWAFMAGTNSIYYSGLILSSSWGTVIGTQAGARLGSYFGIQLAEHLLTKLHPMAQFALRPIVLNAGSGLGIAAGGTVIGSTAALLTPVAFYGAWKIVASLSSYFWQDKQEIDPVAESFVSQNIQVEGWEFTVLDREGSEKTYDHETVLLDEGFEFVDLKKVD